MAFHSKIIISDPIKLAKKCVSALIDDLLKSGLTDDIDRMNIPSAVAACARHIGEFNARLVAHDRARVLGIGSDSTSHEPQPVSH